MSPSVDESACGAVVAYGNKREVVLRSDRVAGFAGVVIDNNDHHQPSAIAITQAKYHPSNATRTARIECKCIPQRECGSTILATGRLGAN
jgi:hypothetical protein